ncbi:MAG: hypothetical protein NTX50_17950 [Candidatus Sumerlaeota bacterium]|nr:hypothetical protein [Candidatus Sumerlaeota bacterium]
MTLPLVTNEEKKKVWETYRAGRPIRVPLRWNVNPRILLLDPDLNPERYDFEAYFNDPRVHLAAQARFQEYVATTLNQYCDGPTGLPAEWTFSLNTQNVFDAAYLGARVVYVAGQVPDTTPAYGIDDVDIFLRRDFSHPLDNPWLKERLEFHAALTNEARTFTYLGRQGKVAPFLLSFDGPLTAALMLFGQDIFSYLVMESDKARRLLETIARACYVRNRALAELAGAWPPATGDGFLADDAVQMIGTDLYQEVVLPSHEIWFEQLRLDAAAPGRNYMHLCGNATRHFPLICERLDVTSFDTGFPVDHGRLRRELGPEVEISGGPEIGVIMNGTPARCADRAREILQSGIMAGGRFILQEGNNLPPRAPLKNLSAIYEACLEHGRYAFAAKL